MSQLLTDIDNAFADDPEIDELGVVMSSAPPNIVLVDHKLGLSYQILKPLFSYTLEHFYELVRAIKAAERRISDPLVVDEIFRLTRAALLVKGDMPMLYNLRKMVLQGAGKISCYNTELHFMGVLFTKHPKSPSSWQHRRWCLHQRYLIKQDISTDSVPPVSNMLTSTETSIEMVLSAKMSESYPKNYYSWMHRLWLLQFLDIVELEFELAFIRTWLISHVSDHSAANHRQQVVLRICNLLTVIATEKSELPPSNSTKQNPLSFLRKPIIKRTLSSNALPETSNHSEIFLRGEEFQARNISKQNNVLFTESCSQCHHFMFLNHVFHEGREIVILRPGNEALWSHLRGNADLLLKTVFETLQERITRENVDQMNNNNSTPLNGNNILGEETPEYSLEDFKIILEYMNISQDEKIKTSENQISEDSAYYFTKLINIINSENCDEFEKINCFLCWIIIWMKNENIFCQNCIDNSAAWNYQINRQMALRYYSFLLFRLIEYFKLYGDVIFNYSSQHLNSNILIKNIDFKDSKSNKNNFEKSLNKSEIVIYDNFKEFLSILQDAFSLVNAQLQVEDSLPRCWKSLKH